MFTTSKNNLKKPLTGFLVLAGLVAASVPAIAHHAFSAEFDAAKPIEVKGVVTKFELVNPHSWLYVDVKAADGTVTNWGFEFGAPYNLKEKGITKSTLTAGTEITVKGYQAKNGKNFAYATVTTLADGRSVKTGGAADAPTTP
ncbi:MAG: DUF6152 family protein [Methylotenera sp.]